MSKAYSEFFTGWHQIFSLYLFKRSIFSVELIGSKLRNKNMALGGSRVMLPRKFFENLDTVMAVLVLFEQFSRQIFFNFFTLNSESFIKYNVFYYKQYSQKIQLKILGRTFRFTSGAIVNAKSLRYAGSILLGS